MPLSCYCSGDYEWWFTAPDDYTTLKTCRRKRCESCNKLIDKGAICTKYDCWREPTEWEEINLGWYEGTEVPMPDKYQCEECSDLYFSLEELGFCVELGEEMRELVREYAEIYGRAS